MTPADPPSPPGPNRTHRSDPSGPRAFGSRWAGWLGPVLAKVRLHAIEPRNAPGRPPLIAKRRRWFAPWLIGPGNLYLRWLGSGVRVLPGRSWHEWERAVHRHLHGVECATDPRGWLILPGWPGVVLAAFAADLQHPPAARLLALSAASRALLALHQVALPWPDGSLGRLSHGDATLRNVIHDPATCRATWFDFDTVHDASIPALSRHADDLRALVYSALEACADLPVPVIYQAVRGAYDDPAPWAHLRDLLARGPLHHTTFQLAQACPSLDRREQMERLLRQGD